MMLQPQDLGGRPGRQDSHLSRNSLAGGSIELLCQFLAFLGGALVHPGDGIHQRLPFPIQYHKGFCLAGKSHFRQLLDTVGLGHIRKKTGKIFCVLQRVKFHKTIVPGIDHGAALSVDER